MPPEWACLGLGPASPRSSASSRGQDQAGGDRTPPLDVLQRPQGTCLLGGPRGRPPHILGPCLRLCLSRGGGGLPAAGKAPGTARPAMGTPTPTAVGQQHTCHHRAPSQSGAQKGAQRPSAAWPKVTETTYESQKFVQTHPPPSLGEQEGSRPGRQVLRAVRADGCCRVSTKARGRHGPGGCPRGS